MLIQQPQGQVYYTLLQEREDKGIKDVAISRIEQLSPFPYDIVRIVDFTSDFIYNSCLGHSSLG